MLFNINAKDEKGKTLAHHASINGDERFLRLLLENQANPNIDDKKIIIEDIITFIDADKIIKIFGIWQQ